MQPSRAHLAALRAWLQGVPLDAIGGRWLATDADSIPEPRETLATLHTIRDALVARARVHGREDLAIAVGQPGRSGVAMDSAVDAVRQLEGLGTQAPQPKHGVHLWLAAPLARRLQAAGIDTLADLVALANARGRSWWRRVPRVGPLAASRLVTFLDAHRKALGPLGAHVTGAPSPMTTGSQALQLDAGAPLPFEAMRLPDALDGRAGANRAALARCMIRARDDHEAISSWLSQWPEASTTRRAYRKEAERFLAWVILERGKAFADAIADDCLAYRTFLADPQPAARWRGPQVPRVVTVAGTVFHNPAWRPFTGLLSPRSAAYSETVLAGLFAWLVAQGYLDSNPWEGMLRTRRVADAIDVDRAVSSKVWLALAAWLDERAQAPGEEGSRMRLFRAALVLLRDTGLRVAEAAAADRADMRALAGAGEGSRPGLWGELRIVGKGGKVRLVPISLRTHAALASHWADRGLDAQTLGPAPLLAPLTETTTPRARAKAVAGRGGYSDRGLRSLVERAADLFRDHLARHEPALLPQSQALNPHAFRHAFGTQATADGVQLDELQACMGHATMATTALYKKGRRAPTVG
ncbi:phage integrase family protein [Cupriavidus sp. UYPR2.512]|uniref:phage integrase family protein n=1 Tax=Cupriavidus sp. UYPR2.512 TaxID=1080187 RepID=UPI0003747F67|nr:phage integrase family protein [Cupriavidus sp. UYPR2.512]